MLFKPYFVKPILDTHFRPSGGSLKDTTCRVVNKAEVLCNGVVYSDSGHAKWRVGGKYAVQTGRGIPTILIKREAKFICRYLYFDPRDIYQTDRRSVYDTYLESGLWQRVYIKVLDILHRFIRDLAEEDILREGVYEIQGQYSHPGTGYRFFTAREAFCDLWDSINNRVGSRYEDNPGVWWIKFKPWWKGMYSE